jgi:ribosomal protein S18 acetylase RimI-like enzyme
MTISPLKSAQLTTKTVAEINGLLRQLRSKFKPETLRSVRATVADSHVVTTVIRDGGRIIGIGFLFFMHTLQGKVAFVEDVIVDETYRGKGLGAKLMQAIIAAGKKNKASKIELTSRPARAAANKLYQRLGFEKRDTNVYRLKLK